MKRAFLALVLVVSPLIGRAQEMSTKSEFTSRITFNAVRAKSTKLEGGDWDDMKDRIRFTISLRNSDPNKTFPGLRVVFYLFGQSQVDTKAVQLMQKYTKDISLAPLEEIKLETPEVISQWDDTGAKFGAKYKGWYLQVFGPDGSLFGEKKTSAFLDPSADLSSAKEGAYYTRKLQVLDLQ